MRNPDWMKFGKEPRTYVFEYTWKDAVLYALGIGAQVDELPFVYERAAGGLKVFPSYCAIAAGGLIIDFAQGVDSSRFLHGEQHVRLHSPLPFEGKIVTSGRVSHVFDKGKGAVIVFLAEGRTAEGVHLFDVEHTAFYLGEGGFGGDPGPKVEPLNPPQGIEPDFRRSYRVPENQALLYRLSGDLNPLHVDPRFARRGGFDRPILHGLCTYGYATRAIVHGLCQGDVSRFREFRARFSNVVYPGETLTTEAWHMGRGKYSVQVRTERAVVITNGCAIVGEPR